LGRRQQEEVLAKGESGGADGAAGGECQQNEKEEQHKEQDLIYGKRSWKSSRRSSKRRVTAKRK
jgi:hypothetical protein